MRNNFWYVKSDDENTITLTQKMSPIQKIKLVKLLISESIFCLNYSNETSGTDKEKFHRLGIDVLKNMTTQLDEVIDQLVEVPLPLKK